MPTTPPVYILLLNYRGTDYTMACLESLRSLDYPNYRIIVIDNDSPDDSVERLQARLDSQPGSFTLIRSKENLGFSGGNNLAIRSVLNEVGDKGHGFIWLLNNDTTVAPDALSTLVEEARKTGGVSGSLILHPDGTYQQAGTRFNWWTGGSKGYSEDSLYNGMPVETLIGASMLIPLQAFRSAGLLDESFFLYFEDGEFSFRLARHGFRLTLCSRSKIYHVEGATTGRKSRLTQYYYYRNRLRLMIPLANPLQKASITLYSVFRLVRSIIKSRLRNDPDLNVSVRIQSIAFYDFWKGISGKCPHNLENLK